MGVAELLGVLLALWPLALGMECYPHLSGRRTEVPPPTNVIVESYNFNISAVWEYGNTSFTPLFTVSVLCYGRDFVEVENCVNISQRYCQLSYSIDHECESFWVGVKSVFGMHESVAECSERFFTFRDGQIGPPTLELSIEDKEIKVVIEDPLTPYHDNFPLSLCANISDLFYEVLLWKNGSTEEPELFDLDSCIETPSTINLHVSSWNSEYCVSAQGKSVEYGKLGEKSKAYCIGLPTKPLSDLTKYIVAGISGLLLLVIVLVAICVAIKKDTKLPKSLVNVIRNMTSVYSDDTQQEGKYSIMETSSSCKQILSEHENEEEKLDVVAGISDWDKEVGADDLQNLNKAESVDVEIPESQQRLEDSDNYFKSLASQEEGEGEGEGEGEEALSVPAVEAQIPTEKCKQISGYDRCHWRLAEEESLVT